MKNKQTFTEIVKEELASIEYEDARLKALLSAYIRINGSLIYRAKKEHLMLINESAKISKFIYSSLNYFYDNRAHLSFQTNRKKTVFVITLEDCEDVITDLDISFLEGKISRTIVYDDQTIAGYLAGAFLANGSINSPATSNYHLEISANSENYIKWMSKLFARYKGIAIEPHIIQRRDRYVLYIKKSEYIADFLVLVGATNSCMEFENVRVSRDFMNSANRLTNMDTANMRKTFRTAERQIAEIKEIDSKIGIDSIPISKVRLLCHLRLENETASMQDLAEMMSEQLNKEVSKSNINHLFRKIHEIYEGL